MPAMPQSIQFGKEYHADFDGNGLTKREHFAGLAMQGLITLKGTDCSDTEITAVQCVRMANSLLAELDKSK